MLTSDPKSRIFTALAFLSATSLACAQTAPSELLPTDLATFKAYGQGPETSQAQAVPVAGQKFDGAMRFTTLKTPPNFWDYGATIPTLAPVKKGDVLWVSLWARRVTTLKESGEAQCEVAFLQKENEREVRSLARVLSFGANWTQFTLPFQLKNDSATGEARLAFRYGYGKQSLEVGGVRLLNYGPNVKVEDLPRTFVRYEGWKPGAAWRNEAQKRIEKHRKGNLVVKVVDERGRPVRSATVAVRMKRHAFGWGTAIDDERINDQNNPDNARYRQVLEANFNKVVFENSLKWGRWMQPKYRESALKSLPWFASREIAVRGHVMVWPSWRQMPAALFTDDVKKNPEALKQIVANRIAEQTGALKGQLAEWDVVNETFAHNDLLKVTGTGVMADWFKQARAGDPNVKLFYNDYTMFQSGPGQDHFYQTIKDLKAQGAPIDGIGEQGHFANSPPGIPDVLATLDKFGALGLPIQVTEFDIDTDDPGLQTDFMRDFTIATFSHPSVMGVMQWGFWEGAHWLPRAAMWDKNWNLRPHGKVWTDLVTKTWWTNADGKTAKNGAYATRGFYGDYEIVVSQGAKNQISKFALSPQNGVLTVTLR